MREKVQVMKTVKDTILMRRRVQVFISSAVLVAEVRFYLKGSNVRS